MPRSKKPSTYWTTETDKAIAEYKKTGDEVIFNDTIYPALVRLVEAIINLNRPSDINEHLHSIVSHCWEQIPKYDTSKPGFSFFNVVARNYYWYRIGSRSKRCSTPRRLHQYMMVSMDSQLEQNPKLEFVQPEPEEDMTHYRNLVKLWWRLYLVDARTQYKDMYKYVVNCTRWGDKFKVEVLDRYLKRKQLDGNFSRVNTFKRVAQAVQKQNERLYKLYLDGELEGTIKQMEVAVRRGYYLKKRDERLAKANQYYADHREERLKYAKRKNTGAEYRAKQRAYHRYYYHKVTKHKKKNVLETVETI
jgi:hypothetical protein